MLLGRLALYGPGAARLHEEIIPVTAIWTEADRDRRALTPLGTRGEETTLDQLERALRDARRPPATADRPDPAAGQTGRPRSRTRIARGGPSERRAEVARDLMRRGEAEARDLARLIEAQRARIAQANRVSTRSSCLFRASTMRNGANASATTVIGELGLTK